jgi:serine phosphatase RsbU (regulator of sigma subunit)/predicted ester cyclase
MTPDEVSTLFAHFREGFVRRDVAALAAFYADNCIVESPAYGRLVGRARVENAYQNWFATFPDWTIEYHELLITGNRVVQTATHSGTDTGGLLSQAPTGNRFRFFAVLIFEMEGCQIVHEHRVYDVNGLVRQLATGMGLPEETGPLYRKALETARVEHELATAAEIQQALLPAPHHAGAGFDVAAASVPCRAIGGDFLDYFDLPAGAFGFALGDVSGKGPPAALLAARLQGMLAAYSSSTHSPSQTLMRVNEELVRRTVESRFATVLYGVLSCDGRLTYSNAGHNPPLIVGRRGFRRLVQGGLIIGVFPDATFDEETVQLDPGDVVVVFSDGVTEAMNVDGAEFGEARLLSMITDNRERSPTALLEGIVAAVHEFSTGAEQSDDVTALVLRYTGA